MLILKKIQDSFNQGKKDFEKEKYDESKINFEKNIVRNPKDFKSYLYLSRFIKLKKKMMNMKKI